MICRARKTDREMKRKGTKRWKNRQRDGEERNKEVEKQRKVTEKYTLRDVELRRERER